MKGRLIALLCGLMLAVPMVAHAQVPNRNGGVQQSGTITPGHATKWITNGVVGDAGGPSAVGTSVNGTFTCPTITVVGGVIAAAANGSCSGGASSTLLIGGDASSCLLIGGDATSCLLIGGS